MKINLYIDECNFDSPNYSENLRVEDRYINIFDGYSIDVIEDDTIQGMSDSIVFYFLSIEYYESRRTELEVKDVIEYINSFLEKSKNNYNIIIMSKYQYLLAEIMSSVKSILKVFYLGVGIRNIIFDLPYFTINANSPVMEYDVEEIEVSDRYELFTPDAEFVKISSLKEERLVNFILRYIQSVQKNLII